LLENEILRLGIQVVGQIVDVRTADDNLGVRIVGEHELDDFDNRSAVDIKRRRDRYCVRRTA
jgi:hypothetical protein